MEANLDIISLLNSGKAFIERKGDLEKVVLVCSISKEEIRKYYPNKFEYSNCLNKIEKPFNPFNRFKPVHIFSDKYVLESTLDKVTEALEDFFEILEMKGVIPINIVGYFNKGKGPHESADWYLDRSFDHNRSQYNAEKIGSDLENNPLNIEKPQHLIFVTYKDIYLPSAESVGLDRIFGASTDGGIILSTFCLDSKPELIKPLTIHEAGHFFMGFPDHFEHVKNSLSIDCIMDLNYSTHGLEMQLKLYKRGIHFCDRHKLERFKLTSSKLFSDSFPELVRLYDLIYTKDPQIISIINSGKLAQLEVKYSIKS